MPPPWPRAIAGEGAVGDGQRPDRCDAAAGADADDAAALLPEKVLLVTVSVPRAGVEDAAAGASRHRLPIALLPEKVLLVTVSVPVVVDAAAAAFALLPEKVLLVTVSVSM